MPDQSIKSSSFEADLLHELQHSGIPQQRMSDLVSAVVGLQGQGVGGIRVFPRGIPAANGLTVQAIITEPNLSTLLDKWLHTKLVKGVVVFPYGVPQVQGFQVEISVGAGPEAG